MRVFGCPPELPAPEFDPRASTEDWIAREQEHSEKLKAYLRSIGYTGPDTGKEFREPMADGYARYMFADAGPKSALIYLPYGDAWHSMNVQYLPKNEVLRRIKAREELAALFAKKEKPNAS